MIPLLDGRCKETKSDESALRVTAELPVANASGSPGGWRQGFGSRQYVFHNMAMHISQTIIAPLESNGESFVVYSKQMK